jgi:serine/threonine-protein kinase
LANPPENGLTLGRYELSSKLASGGMGEVYLARSPAASGVSKTLVVKRILPHLAQSPEFVQRFLDEARLVVGLAHSNVVQVFDVGESNGDYYLAMEHVDGCDLRELMRRLRASGELFPYELALFVVGEMAEGLAYVHGCTDAKGRPLRIVHRDVSPSNVLLSRSGDVKLTDFGVALARTKSSESVAGSVHGKVQYMSPEQAAGQPLDPRSDLFSVGTVLYEMLTGVRPFDADTDLRTLERIRNEVAAPIDRLRPGLPPGVVELVRWCHSKQPGDRPESAHALRRRVLDVSVEAGARVTRQDVAELVRRMLTDGKAGLSLDQALALQLGSAVPAGPERTATAEAIGSTPPKPAAPSPAASNATSSSTVPALAHTPSTGTEASVTASQAVVVAHPRSVRVLQVAVVLLCVAVSALLWLGYHLLQKTTELRLAAASEEPASPERPAGGSASTQPVLGSPVAATALDDASATLQRAPVSPRAPAPGRLERRPLAALVQRSAPAASGAAAPNDEVRTVTIRATPSSALISVDGDAPKRGPRRVPLEAGRKAQVVATLEGHAEQRTTVRGDGPRTVELVLAPESQGEVVFRFFPAAAQVLINGQPLKTADSNLIIRQLPAGEHVLRIVAGGFETTQRFRVDPGKRTQLGTIKP